MIQPVNKRRWVIWSRWLLTFSPQILHPDPLSREVPLPGHLYHWSIFWALSSYYVTYWDTTGEKHLLTLIFIKNTIFSIWYLWKLLERDVEAAHLFLVIVHSPSHVRLFATPWTAACQAPLSFTISWNLPKLMSIESVVPFNYLILCHPLLLPSVLPRIRVFSNESAFHIRSPKYWSFSSIIQSTHSSSFSKLHPCIKSTYQGPAHLVIALATWWVKNGSLFLAISAIKQWSQFPTPLHLSYPSNLVWPVEYGASTTVKLPRLDLGMSTYLKMSAAFPSLLEWFSWPPAAVFWEPKHPSWQPSWAPSWQPAPSAAKWGSHVGCSPQPSSWMMQPQQMWVSLPSWTQ